MAGALGFIAAIPCHAAIVDDVRDDIRREAKHLRFGSELQGVSAFGAMPGVSNANFNVDGSGAAGDTSLNRLNLPLSHEFENVKVAEANLYTELSLGWMRASTDYRDVLAGSIAESDIDSRINAYSAIAGVGLAFPVVEGLTITPIAMLGYSRITDDSSFSGTGANLLNRATRGILFNYDMDDLIYGAGLLVSYERDLANDIGFQTNARYNQLFASTLSSSDDSLDSDSNFGVFTTYAQFDGPTPGVVFGMPVRWIGFAAGSAFFGAAADGLGFDYFVELGGGLELVNENVINGLEGVSLRGSGLLGNDGLTGWSVGLHLEM